MLIAQHLQTTRPLHLILEGHVCAALVGSTDLQGLNYSLAFSEIKSIRWGLEVECKATGEVLRRGIAHFRRLAAISSVVLSK